MAIAIRHTKCHQLHRAQKGVLSDEYLVCLRSGSVIPLQLPVLLLRFLQRKQKSQKVVRSIFSYEVVGRTWNSFNDWMSPSTSGIGPVKRLSLSHRHSKRGSLANALPGISPYTHPSTVSVHRNTKSQRYGFSNSRLDDPVLLPSHSARYSNSNSNNSLCQQQRQLHLHL